MRVVVAALMASVPLLAAGGAVLTSGPRARAEAAISCPAVTDPDAVDYALASLRADVTIPRGGVAEVPVRISRGRGFDAPVHVRAELLPDGVDATIATIPARHNAAILRVVARRNAPTGTPQESVLVGAAFGRIHTTSITVHVTGSADNADPLDDDDEGRTALAVLR